MSIYYILKGYTNNFISIWADTDSSLSYGKFYAATESSLSIVDCSLCKLYDYHTQTEGGRTKDNLDVNDVVDIIIGG
jgi:hypothetical protein